MPRELRCDASPCLIPLSASRTWHKGWVLAMLTGACAPLARGSAPAFRALAPEPSNPSLRDQAKTAPKIRHSLKGQLYKQQRDKCLEGRIRIITKEGEEIIETTTRTVFRGRLIPLSLLFIWPFACPQTPDLGFEPLSEIEGL